MNRLLISLMLALAAITARAQFNNDNLSASVYYNNDFGMWVVDVEMNNENSSLDEKTETNNLNTDELDEILDSSENIDFQELNQDKEG